MSHRFNRAARRHLRDHLIVRRRNEDARFGVSTRDESAWRFANSRVRARTATLCSCFFCCNVRRKYGNSVKGRTKAEVFSMVYLKEALWEESLEICPDKDLVD